MTDRNATIKQIRTDLKARSGKAWSVRGSTGTAWGWITISAPPKRLGCALPHDFSQTDECNDCGAQRFAQGWQDCSKHECSESCFGGYIVRADRDELAALLGLDSVHAQGVSIPSGSDYYTEYIDRAAGRTPTVYGTPYWD